MTTFILIIVFLIIFYIGYLFYQFDNSTFAKETGFNFFQTMTNGKIRAQKNLFDQASKTNAKVVLNVLIEEATHQNFADAIVIHPSALYVIMMRNRKGWISGTDKSYEWVEQLYGGKINKFANPIHENLRMTFAISDLLPEIEKGQMESVIAFSDDCSFQHIEIHSNTIEVLKYSGLAKWMESLVGNSLSKEQIDRIYNALKKYTVK